LSVTVGDQREKKGLRWSFQERERREGGGDGNLSLAGEKRIDKESVYYCVEVAKKSGPDRVTQRRKKKRRIPLLRRKNSATVPFSQVQKGV